MRSFACVCGNMVFFENSQCVSCGCELGWCPACRNMTAILAADPGQFRCGNHSCGALLVKCHNYSVQRVCNRCCLAPDGPTDLAPLCDYCRFNETIPDLNDEGNREKWFRLEAAKRRLLYSLDMLRLPYGTRQEGVQPPLSFDFKSDVVRGNSFWWAMGKTERVYTGHADGKITINICEADEVEREKSRVSFQEAHRTIIGHFRHEIGHYYWQMLIPGHWDEEFKTAFGDHENPTYAESQQRYYEEGPVSGWQVNYISAYATMHPWEDFAETFAAYLDMVSVLDTALHMGVGQGLDSAQAPLQPMVDSYLHLGVVVNEMNRAMGLKDLVPEIFASPIVVKMGFVHNLLRQAARPEELPAS